MEYLAPMVMTRFALSLAPITTLAFTLFHNFEVGTKENIASEG